MWTKDKETLCNMHNCIRYWTMDIRKKLKKAIREDNVNCIKDSIETLNTILETTRRAKKAGQRMEDRLVLLKRGIENLGFIRKPAKSKTSINKKV